MPDVSVQTGNNGKNTTDSGKKTGRDSDESEIPENEEEEQGESGEVNPNDLRKKGSTFVQIEISHVRDFTGLLQEKVLRLKIKVQSGFLLQSNFHSFWN